jgi:hypothetical protein
MKRFFILFVLFFLVIVNPYSIAGGVKTIEKIKEDYLKYFSLNNSYSEFEKEIIENFSNNWHTAEASYYDPYDSIQTRKDTNGEGAFGRKISYGSIALGSDITQKLKQENLVMFVEIKDCNILTPYGKGIFRVDDKMASRYSKKDKYYIDFYQGDLDWSHKKKGRFKKQFRVHKLVNTAEL